MTDKPQSPKDKLQQRMARGARHGIIAISRLAEDLDKRALVGLCFILLGLAVILTPAGSYTTVTWLSRWGLSPRGYGIGLAILGSIILRWPRNESYGLLVTIGFVPYLFGTFGLMITDHQLTAPPILYTFMYLLMLTVPPQQRGGGQNGG